MSSSERLRLGTRASALARWQADWVADRLRASGVDVTLVPITTSGDQHTAQAIATIGGEGLFTREIQRALLDGQIDVAVHSLKDLPTERVSGLCLAAVPTRGPVADVLANRGGQTLANLPQESTVGTSSLRRKAQLLHVRPDLQILPVRGNVETRLGKLRDGQLDVLVLAEAGLARLGLLDPAWQILSPPIMLPAIGQGALGIEAREDDDRTHHGLAGLDDAATRGAVVAERSMLAALHGGCLAPVGGWGRIAADGRLHLSGVVLSSDGATRLAAEASSALEAADELGRRVADDLLRQGAAELIRAAREPG